MSIIIIITNLFAVSFLRSRGTCGTGFGAPVPVVSPSSDAINTFARDSRRRRLGRIQGETEYYLGDTRTMPAVSRMRGSLPGSLT